MLREEGPVELARRSTAFLQRRIRPRPSPYDRWKASHEAGFFGLLKQRRSVLTWQARPSLSLLMPIHRPELSWLHSAILSVERQIYPYWQLCLALDGPPEPGVRRWLARRIGGEKRIQVVESRQHGGIAAAGQAALELATGDFVGLLDQDDELSPAALYRVAQSLQSEETDFFYSDEDKLTPEGLRVDPYFKPGWSPYLLLSQMYTGHFSVYRRSLVLEVGGFRTGFDFSQDHDLALRISEATDRIRRLPHILYHWRQVPGSAATDPAAKPEAAGAARRALSEALGRRRISGKVVDGPFPNIYCIDRSPRSWPAVTAIIPTRDQPDLLRSCIEGLLQKTDYPELDLLIVDHESRDETARSYLRKLARSGRARVLPFRGPFNFSAMVNLAARHARGDLLLLLNNDTEPLHPGWLRRMAAIAVDPGVGAVGARLLYPDGRLQHAGVVLGLGGVAGNAFSFLPADSPGYFGAAWTTRDYSAVTAACMVTPREDFLAVNGFDADSLPVAYNDVDYCLRLKQIGRRTVYCAEAELIHHESASRGTGLDPAEVAVMLDRWGPQIEDDPHYSPNLSRGRPDFWIRLE